MRGLWSAEATPHTRGPRKFLDCFDGTAIMIKGTIGKEVRWIPLTFLSKGRWAWMRWLGWNTGFWSEDHLWHFAFRGRRVW